VPISTMIPPPKPPRVLSAISTPPSGMASSDPTSLIVEPMAGVSSGSLGN
jgi:hypothetical protein